MQFATHKVRIMCVLVLLFSAGLRLHNLSSNPSGFFPDEASTGYDAWSLIRNGGDQHGERWPFFFKSFADDIEGTYRYLTLLSILFLGPSVLAVRLPIALFGIFTVLILVHISKHDTNRWAVILSALIAGFLPWHLPYCRTGQRIMLLPFALALWYWIRCRAHDRNDRRLLLLSWFVLGLSVYTYVAARVVIPMLAAFVWIIDLIRYRTIRLSATHAFIFCLALLPFVYHAMSDPDLFTLRFRQVSAMNSSASIGQNARTIVNNYMLHFSPGFLFLAGDANLRHHQAGFGQLFKIQALLVPLGFIMMWKERNHHRIPLLILLFIAPIPAALSGEGNPHALRSVAMMIPLTLFSVDGFRLIALMKWKRIITPLSVMVILTVMAESIEVAFDLTMRYPVYSAVAWEYGTREAVRSALPDAAQYDEIWITSRAIGADVLIAYDLGYPPEVFQKNRLLNSKLRWSWSAPIQSVYMEDSPKKRLFIVRPGEIPGSSVLPPILYPADTAEAFRFIPGRRIDSATVSSR